MSRMTAPGLNAFQEQLAHIVVRALACGLPPKPSGLADRPFEIEQPPGDRVGAHLRSCFQRRLPPPHTSPGCLGDRFVDSLLGPFAVLVHRRLERALLLREIMIDSTFDDASRSGDLRDRRGGELVFSSVSAAAAINVAGVPPP
jgi:hypothetical protein